MAPKGDIDRHSVPGNRQSGGVSGNIAVAWCSIAVGALTGLLLSLWSFEGPFPVPAAIGDYDDLSRRLLRLGHIAFFGLGILNIMLAKHLSGVAYDPRRTKLAFVAMNLGNVFLPLTLIAAAFVHPLKYLASFPAMAVTLAVIIGAHAALAAHRGGGRR